MRPSRYLTPQHLPFNRTAVSGFRLAAPSLDPGGPGYWLALQGNRLLVCDAPASPLPFGDSLPEVLAPQVGEGIYLGQWHEQPCRALQLPDDFVPGAGFSLISLLAADPLLDIATLSLAGLASQALTWDQVSRCCHGCGANCRYLPGEWGRSCERCRQHHYPPVHPCVIVLIERPGELLLVRKPEWAPDRYSLVAGFVEFGECLEECVTREVKEEVGVTLRTLRYAGSQSWPFPSQLMAGFSAEYEAGEILLDRHELEDGRWFSRGNLPQLPPRRSIARWLIDRWCDEQEGLT